MNGEEYMVSAWIMPLIPVLRGYTLAIAAMEQAGEERQIVEVSYEVMRDMMHGRTLEEKQLLSEQLDLLCTLANVG